MTKGQKIASGLIITAMLVSGFFIYKEYTKSTDKKDAETPKPDENNLPPVINPEVIPPPSVPPSTPSDFPLKKGSRGDLVKTLQLKLIQLGANVAGGADGVFGSGTEAALVSKSFPIVIDKATYDRIIGVPAYEAQTQQEKLNQLVNLWVGTLSWYLKHNFANERVKAFKELDTFERSVKYNTKMEVIKKLKSDRGFDMKLFISKVIPINSSEKAVLNKTRAYLGLPQI